jgi:CheY-like chemotaxis protein
MQDFHTENGLAGNSPARLGLAPAATPAQKPILGRVLVMDDEEPILELTARLLKSRGYEVETATDGGMAVSHYRAAMGNGKRFDVVILDLTVPEKMGGYDAFQAMKAFDPTVRAIVSSGYSHEPIVLNYKDFGITGVAPKPYRMNELLEVVEKAVKGDC